MAVSKPLPIRVHPLSHKDNHFSRAKGEFQRRTATGEITLMLRTVILVMVVFQTNNAVAIDDATSTFELERIIEKRLGLFQHVPCNVPQGFLVHADTRCRVNMPLTDEDRRRGVMNRVIVNFELVCRTPEGDTQTDYVHVYYEQPQKIWKPDVKNDEDSELMRRTCR